MKQKKCQNICSEYLDSLLKLSLSGKPLVEESALSAFVTLVNDGHYILQPFLEKILKFFGIALQNIKGSS